MAREHDLPPGDAEMPGLSTQAAEAIRKTVAIEFREHCTQYGSMPGEWGRWVGDILDPVVPWQQVLHAAVRRGIGWGQGQVDYTYSKISRRQQAVGAAIVPALRRPVPAVAVVVDTSETVARVSELMREKYGFTDALIEFVEGGWTPVAVRLDPR